MDELKKFVKEKILIIEDATQSIGSKFKDKFLGTIGDFGGISFFYGNKIITTGEGGAVITNKQIFHKKLYNLRTMEDQKVYLNTILLDLIYVYRDTGAMRKCSTKN